MVNEIRGAEQVRVACEQAPGTLWWLAHCRPGSRCHSSCPDTHSRVRIWRNERVTTCTFRRLHAGMTAR